MPLRLRRGTNSDRLSVTPLEGELVYTTDTKQVYIGDGATVGGNIVGPSAFSGTLTSNLDLAGYDITGTGDVNITGNITSSSGNLTVNGNGVIVGTLEAAAFQGAVYNRDSSVVVDDSGQIHAEVIYARQSGNTVFVQSETPSTETQILVNADNQLSRFKLRRSSSNTTIPLGTAPSYADSPVLGQVIFESSDLAGISPRTAIQGSKGFFRIFQANSSGVFTQANQFTITVDGNFGVGTNSPTTKLDVAGSVRIRTNLSVTGTIDGDLTGSVFADDSSLVVDANNNKITTNSVDANVYLKTGVYADNTARDNNINAPYAGMIIFNQTGSKFQGYTGSGWVDLN